MKVCHEGATRVKWDEKIPYRLDDTPCGIVLKASPVRIAIAKSVGTFRTRHHDGYRAAGQCLGTDAANCTADFYGVLAELIVALALEAAGYCPEGFEPYVFQPNNLHDFTLSGVPYDVKAIPFGKRFLTVNEAKRQRYSEANVFILPVRFTAPDTALVCRPVAPQEVGKWELRTDRHSPYRSVRVDSLSALRNWYDLSGTNGSTFAGKGGAR